MKMKSNLSILVSRTLLGLLLFIPFVARADYADYTVNLMWINRHFNPLQDYIFPASNKRELNEKFLKNIIEWGEETQGGTVQVWYDSKLIPQHALENTEQILANELLQHPHSAPIIFKDVREFPEVNANPRVFSEDTPVFFRVDLLRVLAAYHTLVPGKKLHFVYGDLDMKPMSREELFDSKTKDKLDEFGIVMTRGGCLGFENGFQIIGNQKPNLLKAIKLAIIDVSIARANHILNGGNWAYKRYGDTQPLEQTVYDSYPSMFYYYYQLEGWGKLNIDTEVSVNTFGLQQNALLKFTPKSPKIIIDRVGFDRWHGKEENVKKIRIPTKIVTLPPSHFGGGAPREFDPYKISMRDFPQKLATALEGNSKFDNMLLYLVARNNYSKEAIQIAEKLSPSNLTDALISETPSKRYSHLSPLEAAIEEGSTAFLKIMISRLSQNQVYLDQVAKAIVKLNDSKNNGLFYNAAKNKKFHVLQFISLVFSDNNEILSLIGKALLNVPKTDSGLLQLLLKKIPSLATELGKKGQTLALKAVENENIPLLKVIAESAPETFEWKDDEGNFPLLLATEKFDLETFKMIWSVSKKMLKEKNDDGKTVAHIAAEVGHLDIIKFISNEAPELFLSQTVSDKETPTNLAKDIKNIEVLKFLVDHYPDTLKLIDRWGWTPASSVANAGNTEGLNYILTQHVDAISSDFINVLERASLYAPECLTLLAEKFPLRREEIIQRAESARNIPPEVIESIRRMKL